MPGQFQCRFCSESYKEVLEFLDHFETHMTQDHSETSQKYKNSCLGDSQENEEHSQKEHDRNISNLTKICKDKFDTEEIESYVSGQDLNSKENSSAKKRTNNKEKVEKSTKCETCNKIFSTKSSLNMHIRTTKKSKFSNAIHVARHLHG